MGNCRGRAACGQPLISFEERIHPHLRLVLPDFLQQRISQMAGRQEQRLSPGFTCALPKMLTQRFGRLFQKLIHAG